jgi:hypothetical protein
MVEKRRRVTCTATRSANALTTRSLTARSRVEVESLCSNAHATSIPPFFGLVFGLRSRLRRIELSATPLCAVSIRTSKGA